MKGQSSVIKPIDWALPMRTMGSTLTTSLLYPKEVLTHLRMPVLSPLVSIVPLAATVTAVLSLKQVPENVNIGEESNGSINP